MMISHFDHQIVCIGSVMTISHFDDVMTISHFDDQIVCVSRVEGQYLVLMIRLCVCEECDDGISF